MAKARRGAALCASTVSLGGSSSVIRLKRAVSGTRVRMMRDAWLISAAVKGASACGASGDAASHASSSTTAIGTPRRMAYLLPQMTVLVGVQSELIHQTG